MVRKKKAKSAMLKKEMDCVSCLFFLSVFSHYHEDRQSAESEEWLNRSGIESNSESKDTLLSDFEVHLLHRIPM